MAYGTFTEEQKSFFFLCEWKKNLATLRLFFFAHSSMFPPREKHSDWLWEYETTSLINQKTKVIRRKGKRMWIADVSEEASNVTQHLDEKKRCFVVLPFVYFYFGGLWIHSCCFSCHCHCRFVRRTIGIYFCLRSVLIHSEKSGGREKSESQIGKDGIVFFVTEKIKTLHK